MPYTQITPAERYTLGLLRRQGLTNAEMARILFELLHFQREIGGELVGPDGTQGFRGIRWVFERGVEPLEYLAMIYALLAVVLAGFLLVERSRLGATLRSMGEDPELAAAVGIDVNRLKLGVAAAAGALAALGGVLFAHHNTYIEPRNFDIMLGVHSLAYALIGGMGTALGPLLGVVIDIGALEGSGDDAVAAGGMPRVRLAVLPFTCLNEGGPEYFSDGLTEEMIAQLGRICRGRIGVIARWSSMVFKGTAQRARENE